MRRQITIVLVLISLAMCGCAATQGQLEVGAFRVQTQDESTEIERLLATLNRLKEPSSTIVIYDASGSMRWPMSTADETPRFRPGQEGITRYLQQASTNDHYGLVIFGHRVPSGRAGSFLRQRSCEDIELLLPLRQLDREEMISTINALQLREHIGDTPLEAAIRQSIDVLKDREGKKRIILITDGNDECGGNPYLAAKEAAEHDIKVYTIAFGIGINSAGNLLEDTAEEVRRRLIDSANVAEGKFFDTQGAEELYQALLRVELAFFRYALQNRTGETVATGAVGDTVSVDPGRYQVIFQTEEPFSDTIRIRSETKTKVFIALSEDGTLEMRKVFDKLE